MVAGVPRSFGARLLLLSLLGFRRARAVGGARAGHVPDRRRDDVAHLGHRGAAVARGGLLAAAAALRLPPAALSLLPGRAVRRDRKPGRRCSTSSAWSGRCWSPRSACWDGAPSPSPRVSWPRGSRRSTRSSSGSPRTSGPRRSSRCCCGGRSSVWSRATPAAPAAAAVGAGLLFGLAILTRETVLYFLPFAALWLAWRRPGGAASRGARRRRGAPGRAAVDGPQLARVRRLRAGVDRGRAQPLAGQHAAHAPGGVRGVLGGARPHPEVRARARARDSRRSSSASRSGSSRSSAPSCRSSGPSTPSRSCTSSAAPTAVVRRPLALAAVAVVLVPYLAVLALFVVGLARLPSGRAPLLVRRGRRADAHHGAQRPTAGTVPVHARRGRSTPAPTSSGRGPSCGRCSTRERRSAPTG